MNSWWEKQIHRAEELRQQSNGSTELVTFYAKLLQSQAELHDRLTERDWVPNGELAHDIVVVADRIAGLLTTVALHGPATLAHEAEKLLNSATEVRERLRQYWTGPSDTQFFGKACLQPYFQLLAKNGVRPEGREAATSDGHCGFCGGLPQVSVLRNNEGNNRDLLCATCLTFWPSRRVLCAHCGEERPAKLGYFHSPELAHIRIEACETCKYYVKGVDLTQLGFAEPLVDDIASAPLDLWAREHGYRKIELNLVGL